MFPVLRVEPVRTSNYSALQDAKELIALVQKRELRVTLKRDTIFKCSECRLGFLTNRALQLHKLKHQIIPRQFVNSGKDENRFIKRYHCEICEAGFVVKSTLEAHLPTHDPFPHVCHCGIGFYLKNDLNEHKRLVHTIKHHSDVDKIEVKRRTTVPKKPELMPGAEAKVIMKGKKAICGVCNRIFAAKSNAQIHMRTHTGERPYECDICNLSFTQGGALKVHKLTHTNIRNFKCSYCNKAFRNNFAVKNHERIHRNEKPFVCRFCEKAFCDQSAHQRHERTHTGLKPYKCEYCPMAFSDSSGYGHHKKIHIGERSHKCSLCPKSFFVKSELMKHEHLHKKEKNFECDICGKKFALKSYLVIHMEGTHLGTSKTKCKKCSHVLNKYNLKQHMKNVHGIKQKSRKRPQCLSEKREL